MLCTFEFLTFILPKTCILAFVSMHLFIFDLKKASVGKYFLTHNGHESLCVIKCEHCMILIKLGLVSRAENYLYSHIKPG